MSAEQTATLTYEFESIAKKLDYLQHLTKGYASLFQQRGNTEIEYAKHLIQQCSTPMRVGTLLLKKEVPLDSLENTMKSALTAFNTETLKVAQRHNEMGVIFIEQVSKPLENLQRTLELNRKRIVNEYLVKHKNHQLLIKNAEKSAEQYKKAVNELKQITSQLNTAMTQNVTMVDKLVARKQQAVTRVQTAENNYKQAVEKANAFGEEMYGEPVKKINESAIELIKNQFDSAKNVFGIVATQLTEIVPIEDEAYKTLKTEVDKMSYEEDLEQFVKANANVHSAYVLSVELDTTLNETPEDNFVNAPINTETPATTDSTTGTEKKEEEKPVEEEKKEEEKPVEEEKKEEEKPVEEEKKEEEKPVEEEKKEEKPAEEEKKE
ncbi:hypothetical protein CL6EHI_065490 [Entamoeba histolytica]|uniref:F-BAR domain-containing protein n=3 Tax=Entamoeba histolytica TaxID=5759 RepID=B1N368_ENTH1|nr:hypothetical protein EHI_065490 [Entamoeba histolytica HM-1:IMSS]EDS89591.1 hypothetical protein EHI_065490 [Entamoeba histolytica HM-1:IMSS]ENY59840.1 hypothetical protein EHI7A_085630 [Entamoeba histolytica HM-1:IMSS-A]GAT94438.1 hypothetical protein CL6EHI_065490 [Entamoeba histolytica]|eukprot:XP_001913634.1 hypothetical protein EHI_065490 [Entamoeba histolytica HM-1:IMSS]